MMLLDNSSQSPENVSSGKIGEIFDRIALNDDVIESTDRLGYITTEVSAASKLGS